MCSVVYGQVVVQVNELGSGDPVPYAHVMWRTLDGEAEGMSVTGPEGRSALAHAFDGRALEVRVSFVGLDALTDTLVGPGPFTLSMVRNINMMQELLVTGQYRPRPAEEVVQRMKVVDARTIQRMAANDLASALRQQVNMRIGQDNLLGASMTMQGLGGENVKVLIDGIPVTGRLNGNVDLSQIDLSNIERVEIVEGPLSVNYGTNALAGTINLITRKSASVAPTLGAKVHAEHIGRLNTVLNGSARKGKSDLLFAGGRNFFAGWDPGRPGLVDLAPAVADTSRYQQWKPREQYFARVNYRWTDASWRLGYKGEVMHDLIIDRGRPRAPYFETAFDQEFLTLRTDNALFAEHDMSRGRHLSILAAHNRYRRTRATFFRDLTDLGSEPVTSMGMQDTTTFQLTNVRAVLSTGKDSSRFDHEVGADVNVETGSGERIGDGQRTIADAALFASIEYRPSRSLTLRPAARVAYNSQYAAPLVPSLNVRWAPSAHWTFRAAYAQGFRAPSIKELYLFFVDVNHDIVGNPDLAAERSHHGDMGVDHRHARASGIYTAEAGVFVNDVQDMITLAQLSGARYSYVNIGSVRTFGGSVGAGWNNGHWIVSTGAALSGREDDIAAGSIPLTPEARLSLTKEWRRLGWSFSLFYKFQGEQVGYVALSETEVGRNTISAFHMADANVAKILWKERLRLAIGCMDLFDVRNVNATLSGGAHSAGGASVPMTTGRTFFLRIDLDLKRSGT